MLILFYDTQWGAPVDLRRAAEGVEFSTDKARYDEAAAVVFHLPEWTPDRFVSHRPWGFELALKKRPSQLWVAWSMECEDHFSFIRDGRFMHYFDLRMTYHLDADVPATYLHSAPKFHKLGMLEAFRRPPLPKKKTPLLASFVSSDFDRSGRRDYLKELAKYIEIDSFGKFMNNKKMVFDSGTQSKLDTISKYKFTIAFENANSKDYVTEKFYDPLWAGSVPVYLGAPNVGYFSPGKHCYIDASDFQEPKKLADYLTALDNDDDAYNAYFKWKENPYQASFEELVAREAVHPFSRLCKLVKDRYEEGDTSRRPLREAVMP